MAEERESNTDFYMAAIRAGTSSGVDRVIRKFRDGNTSDEELINFLNHRDEYGLCPLHWTSYNTNSSHNLLFALVSPIRNHTGLYNILALRVIQTSLTPLDVEDGNNLFQIGLSHGSTASFEVVHRYNIQGLEEIHLQTAGGRPVLCVASGQRVDDVEKVLAATPQAVKLIKSSQTEEEGWTSLEIAAYNQEDGPEIISCLLSKFDDTEEKMNFVRHVDKDDRTALQLTADLDAHKNAAAILDEFFVPCQEAILRDVDGTGMTIIHMCAFKNATKLLSDLKGRLPKGSWRDLVQCRNSNDETALHMSINDHYPGIILLLTEFLGEHREEVLESATYNSIRPEDNILNKILTPTNHINSLHYAASVGDRKLARYVLEKLPGERNLRDYVEQTNQNHENVLHILASSDKVSEQGRREILEELVNIGSTIGQDKMLMSLLLRQDRNGFSPCHKASQLGELDFLIAVIEHMESIKDLEQVLQQQTKDHKSMEDLINTESTTGKAIKTLLGIVHNGVEETINTFKHDFQSCFRICRDIPLETIRETIHNSTTDMRAGFAQQHRLWNAAVHIKLGMDANDEKVQMEQFDRAESIMRQALSGEDCLQLYSNMCQLRLLQGDPIDALLYVYQLTLKQENHAMRLRAKSDFAFVLTTLGQWSDLAEARKILEEILEDEKFESIPWLDQFNIMATYARILPRISSRNKGTSPKDKQQHYQDAFRIFDDMKKLVQQAEEEAHAQSFTDLRPTYPYELAMCLIWKCDIAAGQYDWSFSFKEDLHDALAMLKFIEHGDYLPTRIAKICNSICYGGFHHFSARELEEFHDMGLKAYAEASQCGTTTRTAEFTKAQLLLFKHHQDLFESGEANQDFFQCILHYKSAKNIINDKGKRAFMKHMRYHYCTPVGESDQKARDILSRVRDITQAVDERSLHRVFSQNLSVLIITRFRLGESAASLEEYVQGRDMNTWDSAGIKLSLGRFHHYEYRLNNQQSSLENAKKLYADAGKIHWEAEELLKALSSYARIN